jgi:predicted nucleic acid-binding protein
MLIDTSGFLCLYEKGEPDHERALAFYDAATARLTTSYVLTEYTALAQVRGIPRLEIIKFSTRILEDEEIELFGLTNVSTGKPSSFSNNEKTKPIRSAMPPVSS